MWVSRYSSNGRQEQSTPISPVVHCFVSRQYTQNTGLFLRRWLCWPQRLPGVASRLVTMETQTFQNSVARCRTGSDDKRGASGKNGRRRYTLAVRRVCGLGGSVCSKSDVAFSSKIKSFRVEFTKRPKWLQTESFIDSLLADTLHTQPVLSVARPMILVVN